MEKKTHIELCGVIKPNSFALIAETIEEQESPKAILRDEPRETNEGERSDGAERELNDGVVRTGVFGVAGRAGEGEVRNGGNDEGEEQEN